MFSSFFLGTAIQKWDWIGTLLIFVGCAFVSLFGSKIPNPGFFILMLNPIDQDIDQLIDLFTRPAFVAYSSILIAVTVMLIVVIKSVERSLNLLKDVLRANSEITLSRRSSRRSISIQDRTPSSVVRLEASLMARSGSTSSLTAMPETLNVGETVSSTTTTTSRRRPTFVIETTSDLLISPHPLSPMTGDGSIEEVLSGGPSSSILGIPISGEAGEEDENAPLLGRPIVTVRSIKRGQLASLVGILNAVAGGILASMTLLLTKSGVELVLATLFSTDNHAKGIFSIIIVILSVITALGQVHVKSQILGLSLEFGIEI